MIEPNDETYENHKWNKILLIANIEIAYEVYNHRCYNLNKELRMKAPKRKIRGHVNLNSWSISISTRRHVDNDLICKLYRYSTK